MARTGRVEVDQLTVKLYFSPSFPLNLFSIFALWRCRVSVRTPNSSLIPATLKTQDSRVLTQSNDKLLQLRRLGLSLVYDDSDHHILLLARTKISSSSFNFTVFFACSGTQSFV
eukprot:2702467-Rhodomonas_salina.1